MNLNDQSPDLLAKYKKALSHAKMGLWEIDFLTHMMAWDEGIQMLYESEQSGFTTAPLEYLYQSIHPVDSIRLRAEIENSRLDIDDLDSLFRITLKSSGKEKFIRTKATRIRNANNEVVGLSGVNWDVTNEKKLQEDLEKTKIFFEKVIEAIPDPLFIKDSQHRTIFTNHAFERICGKEKKELVGKLDSDYLPQDSATIYWEQDNLVMAKDDSFEFEEKTIIPNGTERHILTKKTSVHISETERILIGVIRDITEMKNIQKSLIEQSKMASLGEMAAGIAHEINNPLTIIQAKSQMLQEKFGKKDSDSEIL